MGRSLPAVLSIAGSDSSGGAGIQADLKTMLALGVYGMTAITALTAQNTTGVREVQLASPDFLAQEIEAVFDDIRPAAVKIGMLGSAELTGVVAEELARYGAENVVFDPVMVATSGASLAGDAVGAMADLMRLATVVTPNLAELEVLAGSHVSDRRSFEQAAVSLSQRYGVPVLAKGGHLIGGADDLLVTGDGQVWLPGERIDNPNTHGTGCTLSSAIAAELALGHELVEAVRLAKDYLTQAIAADLDMGHGSGPLDHAWQWR